MKNKKLPNLNPNKAPVTSAGLSAAQMRDKSPKERKAIIKQQRGRTKPAQTTDTRTMAEQRFSAGDAPVKKAPSTQSKWQKSVASNPTRAKKAWKKKESKSQGKKVAAPKGNATIVKRGVSEEALKAKVRKTTTKAARAKGRQSKAPRGRKPKG
jgi:hypothetical protein